MTTAFPDWFYPGPPGGWTADMLDHLSPPRRTPARRTDRWWAHHEVAADDVPSEDVRLVAEVVSEKSRDRDRTTKPSKYSSVGIRHFWRIELEDDQPVADTFELEPVVKAYVPTGSHRGRLRADIGYQVDIDLDLGKVRR